MVLLIPHTSHIFRPLDLAVFSSLKSKFRTIMSANPLVDDMAAMNKAQLLLHYQEARARSIILTYCAAGYSAAGIWPFDPSKCMELRFIPSAIQESYIRRTSTPPPATIDSDVVFTPCNRALSSPAVTTVSHSITVDRTVRTLFAKTRKVIDSHSNEIPAVGRKIPALTKQVDTFKKKQKRERAVDSNLLLVGLKNLERATAVPITPAMAIQPHPEGSLDPFVALADRLCSIKNA